MMTTTKTYAPDPLMDGRSLLKDRADAGLRLTRHNLRRTGTRATGVGVRNDYVL